MTAGHRHGWLRVMNQFTIGIAILLAAAGSLGLATGSVRQHRAVTARLGADRTLTTRQTISLLAEPRWLAGLAAIGAGTAAGLAALVLAPVRVVQPVGVLAIVWSVLITARIRRARPTRETWRAVLVTALGLIGFTVLSVGSPTPVPHAPDPRHAVGAAAGCLCLSLMLAVGRRRTVPRRVHALRLAFSGAVLYGLTAALVKLATILMTTGEGALSTPVLLSLAGAVAACLTGALVVQRAYAGGRAEVVVATLTTVDPMVAVGLGLMILGEGTRIGPAQIAGMVVCGLTTTIGVCLLSRHHPMVEGPTEPPAPGPRGHRGPAMANHREPAVAHHRGPAVAVVSDYSLATLGGAENAFAQQVRALAGVTDVLAACPASERLEELGHLPGVSVLAVPVTVTLPGLGLPVARNTSALRAMLREAFLAHRIDVVHVHSEFGIAAAAICAAGELGIPTVETVHTFFWQAGDRVQQPLGVAGPGLHRLLTALRDTRQPLADRPGDAALRNMTLTCALRADRVISPSAHQAERLRSAGLQRVEVLPNTVDADPAAEPVGEVNGPLRVLWIGRFAAEKRVLPFIDAALRALDIVGAERLQVELVGTGPQFRRAVRMIEGRSGIRLSGRLGNDEIPARLAGCHLTVLSSVGWDNQPMTVAESLTALRPVIWCDPALTEGLVEAGIPAFGGRALADRLIRLALDPGPVTAASARARSARRVFSAEHVVPALLDIYHRAGAAHTDIDMEQAS